MLGSLWNNTTYGGLGGSAISAVDIALWDITGKVMGVPISTLLGGRLRNHVAVYATGLYYTKGEFPDRLLDEARGYVEAGFMGMKTKVGGLTIKEDVKRVSAIREAIGPDIFLAVDANCAYNPASAIRIGKRLENLDIHWFEEPVSGKDVDGYLQVKSAVPIPIAGGEGWRTRFEFRDFLARNAIDIAQPDVVNVGGITEARHVAVMANAFGIKTNLHVWGSPIMIAASLHVSSVIPPCPRARVQRPFIQEPVMEYDRTPSQSRDNLSRIPFEFKDGFVKVPTEPGLGIEIDEDILQGLCVKHDSILVPS
jgi:D-galactarolactone cycloisomerase